MSLPVHVSKMDDVIKTLIYNTKLILFRQSPYIIKPINYGHYLYNSVAS